MKKILLTLAIVLCITTIAHAQSPTYYGWRGNNLKAGDIYADSLYATAAALDSAAIKNGSLSGADLVNPLRYTGNVGITGTLGVGRGTLPNAKTVFSIYPTAAQGDTALSIRNSAGTTMAFTDTLGSGNFSDVVLNKKVTTDTASIIGLEIGRTSAGQTPVGRTIDLGFSDGPTKGFIGGISARRENAAANWNSTMGFYTSSEATAAAATVQALTQRMLINYDGKIGIGTSAPTSMLSIKGVAANGDTIQNWRSSLGNTVAWVDTLGHFKTYGDITVLKNGGYVTVGLGAQGPIYAGRYYNYIETNTPDEPAYAFGNDANLGIYRVGPDRMGVAAKGANVAIIDSSGVAVTGAITGSKAVITTAGNVALTSGQSGSTRIIYEQAAIRADTLASCAAGLFYDFAVSDTDSLVIAAAAGDTILDGTVKNTRTSTVNGTCRLLGISTNIWMMLNKTGTWTPYDN